MTALAIFTSKYSNNDGGGPRVGRGASAGLWMSQRSVDTLTLIPIFVRVFEATVGVRVLLETELQVISHPSFARVAQLSSNSLDRSAKITSSLNVTNGSTQISWYSCFSGPSSVSTRVAERVSSPPRILPTCQVTAVRLPSKTCNVVYAKIINKRSFTNALLRFGISLLKKYESEAECHWSSRGNINLSDDKNITLYSYL